MQCAARIMTNSSYDAPVDALIEKLNWPAIAEIIKRETEPSLASTYLSNLFSKNSIRDTVYFRNSETELQVPLLKTANRQNSFAYRGAHLSMI